MWLTFHYSMAAALALSPGHERVSDELARLEQARKRSTDPSSNSITLFPPPPLFPPAPSTSPNTITLHSATSTVTVEGNIALHNMASLHLPSISPPSSLFFPDSNCLPPSSQHLLGPSSFTHSSSHSSLSSSQSSLTSLSSHTGAPTPAQRDVEPLRPSLLLPQDPELSVHPEEARSRSGVCPGRVVSAHSHSLDCSVAGGANQGSGDSVFLRPSPRRNDLRKHRNLSVDLPLSAGEASDGQQLRPLSTFGVAMNVSPTPAPLEQRGSEWGLASVGGRRPRLIKRPSVDSGISLSHEDPFKRASLDSGLDGLQKHVRSAGCNQASGPGEVNTEILPDDLLSSGLFDLLPAAAVATSAAVAAGTPSATHAGAAAVADMESTMVEEESATASSSKGVDSSYCSRRGSAVSDTTTLCPPDDSRVLSLAETIIAALPERIKIDGEELMEMQRSPSNVMGEVGEGEDLGMEVVVLGDDQCSATATGIGSTATGGGGSDLAPVEQGPDIFSYRLVDAGTPCSSLSPASSCCLPSPSPAPSSSSFCLPSPSPAPSSSFALDSSPTTADFSEFFHASTRDFSTDFSNLTLSDQEQRELYEAAKIIQTAYRQYKGRKKLQAEQDKERQAAVLIQNYYRRYKQYVYFTRMSRAATLIQNQFRYYCEHKRFKKGLEATNPHSFAMRGSRESTPIPNLKRSYSQRRQHQAARKIQQFMRQTKQKLQKERQAAQSQTGAPDSLPPFSAPLRSARQVARAGLSSEHCLPPELDNSPSTRARQILCRDTSI
ncbi:P-loop containing nucleoside triphosphate hydrolase [Trinorchestia longiramus]|nr:P-loop containing nucleoside triphosphate hydrolase [Trinorchestia longiramus]